MPRFPSQMIPSEKQPYVPVLSSNSEARKSLGAVKSPSSPPRATAKETESPPQTFPIPLDPTALESSDASKPTLLPRTDSFANLPIVEYLMDGECTSLVADQDQASWDGSDVSSFRGEDAIVLDSQSAMDDQISSNLPDLSSCITDAELDYLMEQNMAMLPELPELPSNE